MSPCSEFQHVEPFLYVIESTENEPYHMRHSLPPPPLEWDQISCYEPLL